MSVTGLCDAWSVEHVGDPSAQQSLSARPREGLLCCRGHVRCSGHDQEDPGPPEARHPSSPPAGEEVGFSVRSGRGTDRPEHHQEVTGGLPASRAGQSGTPKRPEPHGSADRRRRGMPLAGGLRCSGEGQVRPGESETRPGRLGGLQARRPNVKEGRPRTPAPPAGTPQPARGLGGPCAACLLEPTIPRRPPGAR